ncbi:MAG TPA: hypothetical protein VEL12_14450 [Candidatus Nitrosopolaris sp.]|nr:hypothetical protein [Candidatus Nitrosopolaris sp.]
MSLNPDVDQIVPFGQPPNGAEGEVHAPLTMVAPSPAPPVFAVAPAYEQPPPAAPAWQSTPQAPGATWSPAPARKRSRWIFSAAIAVVGLIASGTLGYFLYTTTGQRDAARHQLASTQATLADTDKQLAARKATAAYVDMYVQNSGRVTTDYENVVACNSYVTCRTSAQDALTDLKTFQSARSSSVVPSALTSADSQIGDALSAALAADQELITGMDTDDNAKVKEGFKKLDQAMLSFAKAQAALGSALV